MPGTDDIRAEYARRLAARRTLRDRLAGRDRSIGNGRLAVFAAGLLLAGLAIGPHLLSLWWVLAPLAFFIFLVFRHEETIRQRMRAERAMAFYEHGLARIEDRWAGRGVVGTRFLDPAHPYAADLDLFGHGSLFQLLCLARTRAGEECLADWLLAPAPPETVRERQKAIADLRSRLDLREDLALLGQEVRPVIDPQALAAWGVEPSLLTSPRERLLAALIATATVAALITGALGHGWLAFAVLVMLGQAYDRRLRPRVRRVVGALEKPARDLALLAALLERVEAETFTAPHLLELRAELEMTGAPPSARIAQLQTLIAYLDARRNDLFVLIGAILLWTTQWAFGIEGWRAQNGPHLERWLRVLGEFEALNSLAAYACEHPDDPFPEVLDTGACFEAEGITHPLLPAAQAIRNDVTLGNGTRLLIVSGSNMSGKSTLLRTLGTNAVLALAGAPVRARRMRLSHLQIGASIRTQDSLLAGVSRFYAEIQRLHQIVELSRQPPALLFLLDEILQGTNSHDRRVGAEAVVRLLMTQGSLGLITTHDLALAKIAEDPALAAINVHFEDQLEDGRLRFDYHLRPGVVTRSNALELMRAVGLDV
ncbi:MAG TPA: hypothetical protein VKT32_01560 [Chthonomonadaceae bacterium]|nr:hypothetical protein [Chthonomonadaceae bacterium]